MSFVQVAAFLVVSFVLSGCWPYVGHRLDKEKSTCVDITILPFAFIGRGGNGACYPDLPEPPPPAAPELKHVLYTETQRLGMAEEAARIFYPSSKIQPLLAESAAHVMASSVWDGSLYFECNKMEPVLHLEQKLQGHIPEAPVYKVISNFWSSQYSDVQLQWILGVAKEGGVVTGALNKKLKPQQEVYNTIAYFQNYAAIKPFVDARKADYVPELQREYDALILENRYPSEVHEMGVVLQKRCSRIVDKSTGTTMLRVHDLSKSGK